MPVMDRYESMKMLSSSASQYLPPDYLQPLPTTLDAKNSPLALLAQTCSSIGKDPPPKSIIPPLEKKDTTGKSSPSDSELDTKSTPLTEKDGRSSLNGQRTSRSDTKDISNFYPISTSSPKPEKCHTDVHKTKDERKISDNDTKSPKATSRPMSSSSSSSGLKSNIDRMSPKHKTNEHTKEIRDSKYSPSVKSQRLDSPIRRDNSPGQDVKHQHSLYPGLPYGPFSMPNIPFPGGMQPSAEAMVAAGYPYGLPGHSSYSLASAHALAAHQAALKSGSSAALSQYMQYARMRNPTGPSACKDPYCTNCVSSAPPNSHLSQCSSPGCAQCSHEKTLQGIGVFGLPGSNPLHSPFSVPSSASLGLTHLHNLYAQNLLTQQGQQHVCNWMMGSDYCGKRFNSSEELLQHLRTHTSGGESALSAYSSLGLSIPPPTDLPPGLSGYLGSSGNISPETLRRMYPTSISPLSGSALSNRYHPYKSALPNMPSGIPSQQSLSSLSPYYSPYSLYAQRLGAAAVP
ncbi:zinc finger protein Noc-like [Mercenaria mercenaria]|uniref:zinc finger protein Noc-like n=1 Tax=Mercenaria mercenaria TaxID=6596 RepID=UPI00234F75F3|nr:zinc finger protein Noc-like [Mercenaria mercenaria]